jgi:hypothetical protein
LPNDEGRSMNDEAKPIRRTAEFFVSSFIIHTS